MSSQLALSLGDAASTMATRGYTDRTGRAVATERHRLMAAHASKIAGVSLTPEMIACVMLAERAVCALSRPAR